MLVQAPVSCFEIILTTINRKYGEEKNKKKKKDPANESACLLITTRLQDLEWY